MAGTPHTTLACFMLLAACVRGQMLTTGRSDAICPPPGFDSAPDFSISKYISAPWYVQQQVPLTYQPPSQLYCVRAQYSYLDPSNPSAGLLVQNYANRDRVNGPAVGTSGAGHTQDGSRLIAIPDTRASGSTAASKLLVGPESLRSNPHAFGSYWVVAVGPSSDSSLGYDWAIIVGGSPRQAHGNGCRAGRVGLGVLPSQTQYFGGLWLFSRKPEDPAATQTMLAKVKELGLDSSELLQVQQAGCKYEGA